MIATGTLILGRAAVGGFAGLLVISLATAHFPFLGRDDAGAGYQPFRTLDAAACLIVAAIAAIAGAREIRGRYAATLQWMGLCAIAGVPIGAILGAMSGTGKGGHAPGVVLGGPIGAFLGYLIGEIRTESEVLGMVPSPPDGLLYRDLQGHPTRKASGQEARAGLFLSRSCRATARTIRFGGRALLGAFLGLVVSLVLAVVVGGLTRSRALEGPIAESPALQVLVGSGAALFAAIAACFGGVPIPGRAGTVARWSAWGTVAGVPLGYLIGSMQGGSIDTLAGWVLLGGPMGAFIGACLCGSRPDPTPGGKPELPLGGVHDRDLDGP